MRRTERLFALSEALRARRTGVTAEVLAARFGVTVRTIYRDLDTLRAAQFPVHAERGRGGGYALDRSYSLPPVNFTAREAALLVSAGHWLVELRLLPFTSGLRSALDKVQAALPARSQRELAELVQTLSFVGVPARTAPAPVLQAIEQAWFERVPLRLRYEGKEGTSTRVVRLRSVVMERTETRLNCDDLEKHESRQFLLHRIAAAEVVRGP